MTDIGANFFPPGLAVRPVRPADGEPVRALFIAGQREMLSEDADLETRVALKRYVDSVLMSDLARPSAYYSQPRRRLWVVESQAKEIVATVAVDFDAGSPEVASLRRLAVSPEFRRKGVARLLVSRAGQWAAKQGFKSLQLDVTEFQRPAIALYESLGFQRTGTEMYGPIGVLLMAKALRP
jgi:ribosomal protein S18 acetylase RimI-like enzyme